MMDKKQTKQLLDIICSESQKHDLEELKLSCRLLALEMLLLRKGIINLADLKTQQRETAEGQKELFDREIRERLK